MIRSKARTSALLAGLLGAGMLIPISVAQSAPPGGGGITVSVTNVLVDPAQVTPKTLSDPDSGKVAVSATASASFAAVGTVVALPTYSNCSATRVTGVIVGYDVTKTVVTTVTAAGVLTVTANGVTLTSQGAGVFTGEVNRRTGDGTGTVTVTGSASQTVTTTTEVYNQRYSDNACATTPIETLDSSTDDVTTNTASANASGSYAVDLVAPVVTARYSGGGVPTAPTGGDVDFVVEVNGGIATDSFTVSIVASQIDGDGLISGGGSFVIGNNGNRQANVALPIDCDAPLGDYEVEITVSGLATIKTAEDFTDQTLTLDSFEVTPSVNMVGTTTVYGFMTDGSYQALDLTGFKATLAGGKTAGVNTSPGAFHVTNLLKATGQCKASTTFNFGINGTNTYDIELTAPAGFQFVMTGRNYAKVYAGFVPEGGLFDFESPQLQGFGTSEVSSLLTKTANWEVVNNKTTPTKLSIRLDALDKINGGLKGDWYVYLRVRARYSGTTVPGVDQAFPFIGRVAVDGMNGAAAPDQKENTFNLIHAPTLLP